MATCGHCGYESHAVAVCPLCGRRLSADESAGGGAVSEPRVPWEDPSVGFPRNLVATWTRSLFEPDRFFHAVPYDEPALRPLLYFLVVTLLGALFTLWWQTVGVLPDQLLGVLGAGGPWSRWAAVEFFTAPFTGLVMLLVYGAVLHLLALLLAPRRRRFGATLRVLCYAAGPGVLTAVPWIGGLIGTVWSVVLVIVGLREAHRTTTGRAAAIALLPLAALFLLLAGLLLLAFLAAGAWWLE